MVPDQPGTHHFVAVLSPRGPGAGALASWLGSVQQGRVPDAEAVTLRCAFSSPQ